jgi:hypothetical protein
MLVILAAEEAEIRTIIRPYLEKPSTKTELVKWCKVKALSSSPSTTKKSTTWEADIWEYLAWRPAHVKS